ncbi:Peptidase family M28 protein [Rhizoctonia solani]|uniref:Peptide hydrolase n=1 Tax=Rhizoctonia solani TaxID=456999 RepID=A0A8H8P328_9AGAM|nr:Peptidase family M28 protein [Rhizoctonia solani]QRW23422.1 Peptidase family M28 protein [Rhizoctonia solani]
MRRSLGSLVFASALSAGASARSIWITQRDTGFPERISQYSDCLSTSYYGTYGQDLTHVFVSEPECLSTIQPYLTESAHTSAVREAKEDEEHKMLFWLEEALLDNAIRPAGIKSARESISDFVRRVNEAGRNLAAGQVLVNDEESEVASILYSTNTGTLVSLSPSNTGTLVSLSPSLLHELDKILPQYINPTMLPTTPLPLMAEKTKHSAKYLNKVLSNLRFNPDISRLTSSLSLDKMQDNIRWLTGEDSKSPIISRHSFSPGARVAADWIQGKFEAAGGKCKQKPFLEGFSPTLSVGSKELITQPDDSRGSFGSVRAPGGDDDGSGVTHVLAIAQAISDNKISFNTNVELVAFAGEEQGLLGSRAYAAELRQVDANITLMIQADMLAYRDPSEPLQLGLPEFIGLPEAGYLVANVSKIYAPELTVGLSAACAVITSRSMNKVSLPPRSSNAPDLSLTRCITTAVRL